MGWPGTFPNINEEEVLRNGWLRLPEDCHLVLESNAYLAAPSIGDSDSIANISLNILNSDLEDSQLSQSSGIMTVATKQLPPVTVTYEATLVSWRTLALFLGCISVCLVVAMLIFRNRAGANSRTN